MTAPSSAFQLSGSAASPPFGEVSLSAMGAACENRPFKKAGIFVQRGLPAVPDFQGAVQKNIMFIGGQRGILTNDR
jgi:hypothetical protein